MRTSVSIAVMGFTVAAFFVLGVWLTPMMPGEMASHWNAVGEVDGYAGQFVGLFLLPLIALVCLALFIVIPRIDPLRGNIMAFRSDYNLLVTLIVVFLAFIHALSLIWNLGVRFPMGSFLAPGIGILMVVLAAMLPRMMRNYFVGIRTPWTLASDAVWTKTHRHGRIVFGAAGIIACIGAFFPAQAIFIALVPIIAAVLWLTLYSYLLFRRMNSGSGS